MIPAIPLGTDLTPLQNVARITDSEPVRTCAWCPGFDPKDPINKGVSHGICPACYAKMMEAV